MSGRDECMDMANPTELFAIGDTKDDAAVFSQQKQANAKAALKPDTWIWWYTGKYPSKSWKQMLMEIATTNSFVAFRRLYHPYLALDLAGSLHGKVRKHKFVVAKLPPDTEFPPFKDYDVVHRYLNSGIPNVIVRLTKRGRDNRWSYEHAVRRPRVNGARIEVKTKLPYHDYMKLLGRQSKDHCAIYKKQRLFSIDKDIFQLHIFKDCGKQRNQRLIILKTNSALAGEELYKSLPKFLKIVRNVSDDPHYSMLNLSRKRN